MEATQTQTQTPVNSQITDAVTQTNVSVVGEAPAQSMAMVYQSMAHATSLLMQNSVMSQGGMQQINSAVVATACQRIMTLPSQKAAASQPLPGALMPPPTGYGQTSPQDMTGGAGPSTGNGNVNNVPPSGGFTGDQPSDEPGGGIAPPSQFNAQLNIIPPDQQKQILRAAAKFASKAAEAATEASANYAKAQEIAEQLFDNVPEDTDDSQVIKSAVGKAKSASATSNNAATESKKASQASENADALYDQIFDSIADGDMEKTEDYCKQLDTESKNAEAARDKVKEYLQQVEAIQSGE